MNIFGKLLIKSEIVSNIKGDTDKRLAGLKTNDITLTDVQEYDESNVVFAKFKINGADGAEFGMTLRTKKNRLVNSLYALSAIRMADEFVVHECWAVVNKVDNLAHHYLEAVKLPSYPTLLSRKEWMEAKWAEETFAKRTISLNGCGVTEEYYIEPHGEMRKVHATEFDANQDLHRILGRKTYSLYGIVDGEPKLLGTWYGASFIHLCYGLVEQQPLEYQIIDRMPSHFEYNDHPLFFDMETAKEYADSLKTRRHEVWGVKPISKTPVLLGVYESTSFVAAAGLCPHVTKHGFFSELWYNGNPVFPSKYDAAQHIVERYGVKTEYAVYGYNPIMKCADYIGDGVGKTFDDAVNRLFTNLNYRQPHIAAYRIDLGIVGKWRYYGHPLFHTKEQAETYGKRQEALDSIIKSISGLGTLQSINDARETINRMNTGPWTAQLKVDVPKKRKATTLVEIWGINPNHNCATLVTACKADNYDSAINIARTFGTISQDEKYNDHPVFPTKEAAENYLRCPRGIVSTVDMPKTVTYKATVDEENAAKLQQIIDDAQKMVSIGYRIDFDEGAPEGDDGVMAVHHLGNPNNITFVETKMRDAERKSSVQTHINGYLIKPLNELAWAGLWEPRTPSHLKHKVQDLPYFPEVAQAIGTTDAAMELYKVLKATESHDDIMNEELDMAFTWHLSPQGDSFWAEVEARIQDQRAAEEQEILDESEDEGCKPQ